MKYLIIFSAILYSVATSHLEHGAYTYQYQTDRASRSEVRHPSGHINGAYSFVDQNKVHKVRFEQEPNREIQILSHDTFGVIPQDVYHTSKISYRRNLNDEDSAEIKLPPVYVRHVPSPVQHEPIVPIIDVAAPLVTQHHQESVEQSAPSRRSFQQPQVIYHQEEVQAPQPQVIYHQGQAQPQPQFIFHQEAVKAPQPQVFFHHEAPKAPKAPQPPQPQVFFHHEAPKAPQPQVIFHHEAPKAPQAPVRRYEHFGGPLLGADVPLTHDGLTYEVARARDQHFAAIAAVKATVPALQHQ